MGTNRESSQNSDRAGYSRAPRVIADEPVKQMFVGVSPPAVERWTPLVVPQLVERGPRHSTTEIIERRRFDWRVLGFVMLLAAGGFLAALAGLGQSGDVLPAVEPSATDIVEEQELGMTITVPAAQASLVEPAEDELGMTITVP